MEILLICFFAGLLASMFFTEDLRSFWACWAFLFTVGTLLAAAVKILIGG